MSGSTEAAVRPRRRRGGLVLLLVGAVLAGTLTLAVTGPAGADQSGAAPAKAPAAERAPEPKGSAPKGYVWQPDGPCGAYIKATDIGSPTPRCDTGPEPIPAGARSTKLAPTPSNPLPCEGNGTNGQRIQVVYAHQGTGDRMTASDVADMRELTMEANDYLVASGRQSGVRLNWRFVTKNCQLDIMDAQVAVANSDQLADVLEGSTRFQRLDRVYLVYVSERFAHPQNVAGQTRYYRDDYPVATQNINTYGANTARIYWWNPVTVAHELGHAMGAVQRTSPQATGAGHCWDGGDDHDDGADIMCYDDGALPAGRTQVDLCRGDASRPIHYFDCNKDTYFNPKPRPGSYLDVRWNIARSKFMTSAVVDPARAYPAVDDGFAAILGRRADDAGRLFWAGRLIGGANPREIILSLTATSESRRRNGLADYRGDARKWVQAIYRNALCRQPDSAGLNYWADLTRRKGVDYTAAILAGSAEGRRRQAAAPGPGAVICPTP